jgi:PhnB protein
MPVPTTQTAFAPQLIIADGAAAIQFYKKAFGAEEKGRWDNDDGTVHVAELSFLGAIFHIREESAKQSNLSPFTAGGNTVIVGVFVNDVDAVTDKAVAEGAILINPAQDYDYRYRQATIKDPFGHRWLIEKKIG